MPNEFVARNGIIAQNSSIVTGSLNVTSGITGSLLGTASYASNADTLDGLDSSAFATATSFNSTSASFTAFSASINSFSASILSYTSSANTRFGNIAAATASLFNFSSSVNSATSSLFSYTSSTDAKIASIYSTTQSLNTAVSSLNTATSSLNSATSSLQTYTSSNNARITALFGATSSLFNFSSSVNNATSSLYSFTSSLNARTSSFATTGSNTFVGNQTITGSLNISGSINSSGTITAQTLVVQVVTSSQNFITGSTKFGSVTVNTHQFTGSVSASGSLNVNSGVLYADGTSVGIGTTSPGYRLHVKSNNSGGGLALERSAGGADTVIRFRNENSVDRARILFGGTNEELAFYAGDGTVANMFIASGGNVGIGTTSPTADLHVYENSDVWHTRIGGASGELRIGGQNGSGAVIQAYTPGGTVRDLYIQRDGGSVGIGTTSPGARLDVSGNGLFSGTVTATDGLRSNRTQDALSGLFLRSTIDGSTITNNGIILGKAASANNAVSIVYTHSSDGSTSNRLGLGFWSADNLLNLTAAGSVGIGTTSPGTNLEVYGADAEIMVHYTSNSRGGFRALATQRLAILTTSQSDDLVFGWESGHKGSFTEYMRIDNGTGNVGIGTTNPSGKLQIRGDFETDDALRISSTYGTGRTYRFKSQGGNADVLSILELESSNRLAFFGNLEVGLATSGSTRLYINSGGNVGISTTSPSTLLHVYTTTNNDTVGHIQYENANTGTGASTNAQLMGKSKYGTAQLMVWEDKGIRFGMRSTANSGAGDIYFTTGTDSTQMVIRGGSVGIGTTSPPSKFTVSNAGAEGIELKPADSAGVSRILFFNRSDSTRDDAQYDALTHQFQVNTGIEAMRITSGGCVGIGTTTPNQQLVVSGSSTDTRIEIGSSSTQGLYFTKNGANNGTFRVDTNGNYEFYTKDVSQAVVITAGGNVGIGSTSPVARLDVAGRVAVGEDLFLKRTDNDFGFITRPNTTGYKKAGFLVNGGGNLTDFYVYSDLSYFSGNVGIGTTSPVQRLDVRGYIVSNSQNNGSESAFYLGNASHGLSRANLQNDIVLYTTAGDVKISASTASTTHMIIKNGGNVGIGTTNPTSDLHVYDNSDVWHFRAGGASGELRIGGQTSSGAVIQSYTPGGTVRDLYIQRDGGSVGIGTTSPSARLSLGEGVGAKFLVYDNPTNGVYSGLGQDIAAGNSTDLFAHGVSNLGFITFGRLGTNKSTYTEWMRINPSGNVGIGATDPSQALTISRSSGANSVIYLTTDTGQAGVRLLAGTGTTNRATRIDFLNGAASGTTPRWTLLNDYNQNGTNDFRFINSDTSTSVLTLLQNGNVGIGTTSPLSKLHVSGDMRTVLTSGAGGDTLISAIAGVSNGHRILVDTSNNITYSWNTGANATAMVINNNGNVGIGTTSPIAMLHIESSNSQGDFKGLIYLKSTSGNNVLKIGVDGTNNFSEFRAYTPGSGDNSKLVFQPYGGSVGIGTTNPLTKLMVAGTIRANGADGQVDADPSVGAFRFYNGTTFRGGFGTDEWATGNSASNLVTYMNGGNYFIYSTSTGTKIFTALSGGAIGIGTTSPSLRLTVADVGATISGGNAISTSTMKGIRLENTNNSTESIGLWFNTGGNHWSGISGQRTTDISSWSTDLRFYTHETNTVDLTTARERMRISSEGNVGIGSTSPISRLSISQDTDALGGGISINSSTLYVNKTAIHINSFGTGTGAGITFENKSVNTAWIGHRGSSSTDIHFEQENGDFVFSSGTYTQVVNHTTSAIMTIKKGGNVGIGSTSPVAKLDVRGGSDGDAMISMGSGGVSGILNSPANMYINADTANATSAAQIQFGFNRTGFSGGVSAFTIAESGTVTAAADVVAYSDARLKENIITVDNAVEKVTAMRGVFYNRIDTEDKSRKAGVIAQEIQKILPEVVTTSADGTLGVAYGNIVGVLIEAIKELKAEIDILKNK